MYVSIPTSIAIGIQTDKYFFLFKYFLKKHDYDMNLFLFDVDGTLAKSIMKIEYSMVNMLEKLKNNGYKLNSKGIAIQHDLAIVGGGTYDKIASQIGTENLHLFTYIFSENGIVSYKKVLKYMKIIFETSAVKKVLQEIINYLLIYEAKLKLPCMTVSGRNCNEILVRSTMSLRDCKLILKIP